MWILYWVGVIACAGLRVLDDLGNITLTNTETRIIDVEQLFQGVWVDYSFQHNDFPSRVSLDSENSASQIAAIPLQPKTRKKGPSFTLEQYWYFVLYSVDTLELWRGERYPAKMWELHSIHAIAGVDYLQAEGLLYWTEDFLFFYVNLAEGNLTTHEISNITVPANAKVAVCSLANVIVVAELGGTLDHCSHYLLDTARMSVQSQQVTFLNSNATVIDIICTDTLYVLTSIGVVTYWEVLVDSDTPVTAIAKEGNLALLYMELSLLVIHSLDSEAYLPLLPGAQLLSIYDFNHLSIVSVNYSCWLFSNGFSDPWSKALISQNTTDSDLFLFSSSGDIIGISDSEVKVYSLPTHGALLMLASDSRPYSFSICAFDLYTHQEICLPGQVKTIYCDERTILHADHFEFSENRSQILLSVPGDSHRSQSNIILPNYFAGPNLNYSIAISTAPQYVSSVSLLNPAFSYLGVVQMSFDHKKLNSRKCVAIDKNTITFALLTGKHIEIHFFNRDGLLLSIAIIEAKLDTSLCTFWRDSLYYFGRNEMESGFFATNLKVSLQIDPDVHFIGILSTSERIFSYTVFEIYEIDPSTLNFKVIFRVECPITKVAIDEDCIWVLCEGKIQRWSRDGFLIYTFPIPVASEVLINHSVLVLRETGNLSIYRVMAENLVMIKTVSLSLDCAGMFIDSGILAITCSRGIQIISISNAAHNSKLLLIPSNGERYQILTLFKERPINLFALCCDTSHCRAELLRLDSVEKRDVILNINISNSSLFAASKQTLIVGEIIARNEYQSSTRKLVLKIQNVGYLIQLNTTWEQFNFSVPWTDTLSIDLSHLFIGHNITLTTNTSECQLHPKYEVKNRVRVKAFNAVDVCEDLKVFFQAKYDIVEMRKYSCLSFWCQVQIVYEMSQLNISAIYSVKVLSYQGDYVLLQLKGSSLHISMELVLNVDVNSYTYSVVYLEPLMRSSVIVLQESSEMTHIFRYGSIFTHYVLKWYLGFALVSKTTRFLLGVTSVGAVYLESEWRLYLHDSYSGLHEFALRNSSIVFLRSIALGQRSTSLSVDKWRHLALLWYGTHYDVYSLPDFSFINSFICFSSYSCTPSLEIQASSRFISLHHRYSLSMAIETASFNLFATVQCATLRFYSEFDGSCLNIKSSTLDFYRFSAPTLVCSSNSSNSDSATVTLAIQADNGISSVSSPIFTIRRYTTDDSIFGWIAISCLFAAICVLIFWKYQRKKTQRIEEIEMESVINNSDYNINNHKDID